MDRRVLEVAEKIRLVGGEPYSRKGLRNQIRRDTGPLLQAVVAAVRPTTIIELGTGYGVSACHLALGSQDAVIPTVDFDSPASSKAREHFREAQIEDRIVSWNCWSEEAIKKIPEEIPVPDMIFVDHEKAMYKKDVEAVLERMNGRQLVVVADNVEDRKEEMPGFYEWIDSRARSWTVVPTECGLLIAHL